MYLCMLVNVHVNVNVSADSADSAYSEGTTTVRQYGSMQVWQETNIPWFGSDPKLCCERELNTGTVTQLPVK